jgi:hypothetical protein
MKRSIAIVLSILMLAFVLTGCAKAKDAAVDAAQEAVGAAQDAVSDSAGSAPSAASGDTASAFYSAYSESKSAVLAKLMDGLGNNPETTMSAFSFLGATFSDLYLLPALYFGLGETSVATALAMMGAKDVTYQEDGKNYTVTYQSSEGKQSVLAGTYDSGKSLVCVGSNDGVENVFSDVYRTSFGYVGQFYSISEEGTGTLYLFSVSGENGSIGIVSGGDRPAGLTGGESADFTKSAKEWYAVNGNTITGVNAEGKQIQFDYVPSENK